jgi:hypothetical protein
LLLSMLQEVALEERGAKTGDFERNRKIAMERDRKTP